MTACSLSLVFLPIIVYAEKIVLGKARRTCILKNQIEMHIAGRVRVKFGIVADFYAIQFVVTAQEVIERYSLFSHTKKCQSKLIQIRLPLGETNVEFGNRRIGSDRRAAFSLPGGCFN